MSTVHVPFIVDIHKTAGDEDNFTYSSAVVSPMTNTSASTKGSKSTPAKAVGRPKKRSSPRLFSPAKKTRIESKDDSEKPVKKSPSGKKLSNNKGMPSRRQLHDSDEKSSSSEESEYENTFNN